MHFHLGEIRGGRAVSVLQQTLSSVEGVKTTAQISGQRSTDGWGAAGGGRLSCLKEQKELIKEAFTVERKSALVVFTWPS